MAVETKFCVAWIVLSAVFILLSATEPANAVTETQKEGHRCYWCGPYAEQVHRSDRASKCNGDRSKITVCDEDTPFCAIVATFPPYIESRYCVKVYQDECYSLYCNTTKTWKITCPCRGELCNGVNTQRENDAFEAIQKHNVAKLTQNKRSKRALVTKAEFIGMTTTKNTIENTTTEEEKDIEKIAPSENIVTDDDLKNNESNTNDIDMSSTPAAEAEATTQVSETDKAEVTESAATTPTETKMEAPTESPEMTSSETKPEVTSNEIPATAAIETKSAEIPVNDTMIQIDILSADIDSGDLKTDIVVMSSEVPKLSDDKPTDMVTKIIENISKVLTTTTPETKPSTVEIKMKPETTSSTVEIKAKPETTTEMAKTTQAEAKIDKTKSKSNEKLPAAEALQHNDTPTTKMTEQTPTSTITMTMTTHVPTHATMSRNNTAVRINAHILPIVIGVLLLK